jgi:hypothetical protein
MKVGDLVKLRQEMFDDRSLGILVKRNNSTTMVKVLWSNGTEGFHPQRHLEVI